MIREISNGARKSMISVFLNKMIEVGWLLIFAFCPIFFSLVCYSGFVISQYFLFCLLVEVILFFWLIKIILTFGPRKVATLPRGRHWNPVKSLHSHGAGIGTLKKIFFKIKKIFPAFIFIIILGLAIIFSQSPYRSFWGSYSRKMGYLTWLHFFAFFLILFFNLKNNKQIKRILKAILFSSLVVIIYGLCQFLGFDFVNWYEPASRTFRIFSTIGQPNFLGSWLLLVIPIITWFLVRASEKFKKDKNTKQQIIGALIVSLLFLAVFSLVLTQSRGAWVGFFFSFFFFSIIYNFLQKQKRVAILLTILLVIICVFTVYINFNSLSPKPGDSFLTSRFKSLTNLRRSITGQVRINNWKVAVDLIKQKPILGYGPETQSFYFVKYYEPEWALTERINTYADRAHNDFLDTLLVSGVLGLLSYLFLIGSVFYFGLKNIFKNKSQLTLLALLSGLFGYLVSLQFSFHVVPTAIYFWGYMAIILKLQAPSTK
ncbi:hypothetical protein B6D52_00770 [Candidatus Parcubacteria bacterium 4484_255]|nr:MAG: hypothetical protein B6D52_00770 [Candidatus Parcubacteria bacterium 4484_255]